MVPAVQLTQFVAAALRWDREIDATSIEVTAHDGIVTLTGFVTSDEQRTKAEETVRGLMGVRRITNRLEIRSAQPDRLINPSITGNAA